MTIANLLEIFEVHYERHGRGVCPLEAYAAAYADSWCRTILALGMSRPEFVAAAVAKINGTNPPEQQPDKPSKQTSLWQD